MIAPDSKSTHSRANCHVPPAPLRPNMKTQTCRLILASASPRRRELLHRAGWVFEVIEPEIEEIEPEDQPEWDPQTLVAHNCELKAAQVSALHPDRPVLAADTTVALHNHILTKPRDLHHARFMLRMLTGQTHCVHTATQLRRGPEILAHAITTTRVRFHPLTDAQIEAYLERVPVLDKAGAYAAQECRGDLIASTDGSFSNVVGLPMETVEPWLRQFVPDCLCPGA